MSYTTDEHQPLFHNSLRLYLYPYKNVQQNAKHNNAKIPDLVSNE